MADTSTSSARRRPAASRPTPARTPWSRLVRAAVILVAAVILIDALVGDKGLLRTIRARHVRDLVAADIHRLRRENVRLREEARRLREDPDAIEEIARRDLGLIRPGEVLFIIRDVGQPRPPD